MAVKPKTIKAPKVKKGKRSTPVMVIIHHQTPAPVSQPVAGPKFVQRVGPNAHVVTPMRPRPSAPTNSGLRFSGNPNAFRYGGGRRGPGGGGLI